MDIEKEAKQHGLFDPPIELTFETEGHVREIQAQCPDCGFVSPVVHMTVFAADYSDRDCELDLILGHQLFDCAAPKWRWHRFKEKAVRRGLRLIRRKKTPLGIKHINWKPNVAPRRPN